MVKQKKVTVIRGYANNPDHTTLWGGAFITLFDFHRSQLRTYKVRWHMVISATLGSEKIIGPELPYFPFIFRFFNYIQMYFPVPKPYP